MRQAMRLPIYVATLLTVVSAIDIPVFTNFVTTEVATISHSSTVKLIGYLCGQARGNHVNVSLELPHNPDWDPSLGVLYYYVVDSPSKGEADALCTNLHQGVPGPSCNVKSWPSVGDLYITVHSGLADAVAFSVIGTSYTKREVNPGVGGERTRKVFSPLKPPTANRVPRLPPGQETKEGQVIYLAEVVTLMGPQAIPRLQKAHLNFTFCPTPRTGSQYVIEARVISVDMKSTWSQCICDKYPCELSHPENIIGCNNTPLPINTVVTARGQWKQLYALIVCFDGPYDPKSHSYVGQFEFTAVAIKV